jgi:phage major head subunit gpT-like protein
MFINKQALNALFLGFRSDYQGAFEGAPKDYEKIATVVPSATKENVYPWLGETINIKKWLSERVVQSFEAHDYSIKNETFEGTVGINREEIEDDTFGVFKPAMQELGRAAGSHPDKLVFSLLANGFTKKCYDGQPFFAPEHPVKNAENETVPVSNIINGSKTPWYVMVTKRALKPLIWQVRRPYQFINKDAETDDNVFYRRQYVYGVDARVNAGFGFWQMAIACKDDLTPANYEKARSMILGFTNDAGEPLGLMPDLLLVPPTLEGAARRLIINDINAAGASNEWAGSAELLVSPWLTAA